MADMTELLYNEIVELRGEIKELRRDIKALENWRAKMVGIAIGVSAAISTVFHFILRGK